MLRVSAIVIAILGLHLLLHATWVSILRIRLRVSLGDGGHGKLKAAIRAHANAFEQSMPFGLMLVVLDLLGGDRQLVVSLGAAFVFARLLHSFGMLARVLRARQGASVISYCLQLVVALLLVLVAVMP